MSVLGFDSEYMAKYGLSPCLVLIRTAADFGLTVCLLYREELNYIPLDYSNEINLDFVWV